MSEPTADRRDLSLLPSGWARVLLVAVSLLLLAAWWLGAHAKPPDFDAPGPSLPTAPGPPGVVPD